MASADYVCCEECGRKIAYSPYHQPESFCKKCYDKPKAKAELLDEAIAEMRHALVFIRTRQKMFRTGIDQFEGLIERAEELK